MATRTEIYETRSEVPLPESLPNPFARISWGGIIAGLVLVIAVQALLSVLGVGIGLTAADPAGDTPTTKQFSIGSALWWTISNLVALFVGGYVAARLAGSYRSQDGIIHGLITWAVALLLSGVLLAGAISSGISAVGGAVSGIAGTAAQVIGSQRLGTAGEAATRPAGQDEGGPIANAARSLLQPDDPAKMSDEAAAAEIARAVPRMVAGEDVDRDRLAAIVAAKTGVSETEARQRLDAWEAEARSRVDQAKATAEDAMRVARQAAFWGFVVFILGAVAAAVGGCVGTAHTGRLIERTEVHRS
jgi:hypothetical protein